MSSPKSRGFTLIEVLIVVVIIGVLAALIVPRMMGQHRKAHLAEAYQTLGAMVRGQQARMDTTGALEYVTLLPASTDATWARIGMKNPNYTGKKGHAYYCWTATPPLLACYAYWDSAANGEGTNTWMYFNDNGTWVCGYDYTYQGGDNTKACVMK